MTRDEFRLLMELYRQARGLNPLLSYWLWKNRLGLIIDKANRSNANFVNRLKQFNRLTIPDWSGKEDIATHRMSWAEDSNGNAIVYPEVQEIDGELHDFTNPKYNHNKWDALDSAIERGDTLRMTPFEALLFTGGYKSFYPKFKNGTDSVQPEFEYKDIPIATRMRRLRGLPELLLTQDQLIVANEINDARQWSKNWIESRKLTGRYNDLLTDDYILFANNKIDNIPVFVKENDNSLSTANGVFKPNLIKIKYNPDKNISYSSDRKSNILHELSHAATIYNTSGSSYDKIYSPSVLKVNEVTGAPLNNTSAQDDLGQYENSAPEVYSRLQLMRYDMNADPTREYTYDELKSWLLKYKIDYGKDKSESLMNDVAQLSEGTDREGILSTSERPVTVNPYTGEFEYDYNPGAGFLKPVVSIQDAADLTPVGNAIMANDVYQSASQGDYITAGLIGAAALLPSAISKPLKKIVREIPSVNPKYFSDKINKVLGREVRPNGLSRDVYTDAINQRNRVIEDLYTDLDYWDRARAINEQYGDDYTKVYKGVLDTYENKYTGLPEPKAKQFFGDAKAEMAARKDAMERFRMNKIPAGYTDFEYNISPHLDRIDRPTALHELGHYVDFNLSQNANADYNNNMFSALRRDLSTDNNPLYPDKTDYFRQGTELKSYMNTLRSYMLSIGLMDRPGQKVTTKTIKRAIKSLPSEMNAVRAAYLQFNSPGEYTKWFNKIPLLSIPGAAMYFDSKEDNSYADGTDGVGLPKYYGAYDPKQLVYVLPVDRNAGVVLPEVEITPQNNTDLAGYMLKGDLIKEAAAFTPVGDVMDLYLIGKDTYEGNYGLAALGAGLFFLPDIASKPVKKIVKKLSLDDVKDWSDNIWDDYYNQAITNNNVEEAQHLRDLHFKSKAPNTKYDGRLYRGVTNANPIMDISKMEVLDVPGVYTTPYKKYAQSYADADDRVVFNLYGNIENPWIDTFDKKYSFLHPERVKVRMGKYKDKGNIERYNRAKELYDAIKNTDAAYRFLYDTPNEYKSNALPLEIIIRDPNKVKSANPITYDDNGEIIPLSKRDNFNSPDIRYGLIPLLGFGLYNRYNKNKENKSN